MGIWIVIAIAVIVLVYIITVYNKAVALRNYVKEAFSTMDVYLKKRWDLVPNLVETVRAYSRHEKNIFTGVTELRTRDYSSLSDREKLDANIKMGAELSKIIAVAENYPELKANTNYSELMAQLSEIEKDIANARKYYNGTVRELNTFIEIFPSNVVCGIFGFSSEKMFEIGAAERENVKVDF